MVSWVENFFYFMVGWYNKDKEYFINMFDNINLQTNMQKAKGMISGPYLDFLSNQEVKDSLKYQKTSKYKRPFFFDYVELFKPTKLGYMDYEYTYYRIGSFFRNLRHISYDEIEKFLLFFGATDRICSDVDFKKRLMYFFGLLHNNMQIHCLFFHRDVYEIYYFFMHSQIDSLLIINMATWLNNRLFLEKDLKEGYDYTVESIFIVEEFFEFFFEVLDKKENNKVMTIARSQWLRRGVNSNLLKAGLDNKFLLLLYFFNRIVINNFMFVIYFVQKYSGSDFFFKKRFVFVKFFIYKFFFVYNTSFLELMKALLCDSSSDSSYALEFLQVVQHFRVFIVFLIRLYKKFLYMFFYFFRVDRISNFIELFLKIFKFMYYKYIKFVRLVIMVSHLFVLNFLNYEFIFRKYVYKDFAFFFSGSNRLDLLVRGSSGLYSGRSLVLFNDFAYDEFKQFYSVVFSSNRFYFYFLYRYEIVLKYLDFFSSDLKFRFFEFFTDRTWNKYELRENHYMIFQKIGLFLDSFVEKYFVSFYKPVFFSTYMLLGTFKFDYVPPPLRVASIIEDFFDLVSEDTVAEGLDRHTDFDYYEMFTEFYEELDEARLQMDTEENQDAWFETVVLDDFDDDEFVFPAIYDDHLSSDLFANIKLQNTYYGFPTLSRKISADSIVATGAYDYVNFLDVAYDKLGDEIVEEAFNQEFMQYDKNSMRYWYNEYRRKNGLIKEDFGAETVDYEIALDLLYSQHIVRPEADPRIITLRKKKLITKRHFGRSKKLVEKAQLHERYGNLLRDFLQTEARITLKKLWLNYENDRRKSEFFWSNYIVMYKVMLNHFFDFFETTSFEVIFNPVMLQDTLKEILYKKQVFDMDVSDYYDDPRLDMDDDPPDIIYEGFPRIDDVFYTIRDKTVQSSLSFSLMDPRLLFRNGLRVHASYAEQYFSDIFSAYTEYSALMPEEEAHDDVAHGEREYLEKFFETPVNCIYHYVTDDLVELNEGIEELGQMYDIMSRLGLYLTRRFGFGRSVFRFLYFSDFLASEDFFSYTFRCMESDSTNLSEKLGEKYSLFFYSKNEKTAFINAAVYFTAPSVFFTEYHGYTFDKIVFGATSLDYGFKTIPIINKTHSTLRNYLYVRYLNIFSSSRGVLVQLANVENRFFFFLRLYNWSVISGMFQKLKDDGYFYFFLITWPGVLYYYMLIIYIKYFDPGFELKFTDMSKFVNVFFYLIQSLSNKELTRFFVLLVRYTRSYIKHFMSGARSFFSRRFFFYKYNKLLKYSLARNMFQLLGGLLGRSFRFSTVKCNDEGIIESAKMSYVLDNYDLVFSTKMHPTLRNYVSTLVGYFTDDYLLFRFLNKASFLRWLRGDSTQMELFLNHEREISVQLDKYRVDFLGRSSNIFDRLNSRKGITRQRMRYYRDITNVLNVGANNDLLDDKSLDKISKATVRHNYDNSLSVEPQVTDFEDFVSDEDSDQVKSNTEGDDESDTELDDYNDWYTIVGDDEFRHDEQVEESAFEDYTYELDYDEPSTSLSSDVEELDDFYDRRILYPGGYRFLFTYFASWNIAYSKFREYLILACKSYYYTKSFNFKEILKRDLKDYEKKAADVELNSFFSVNYNLNNAIIKSVYQVDNLEFLDLYTQPRIAGDEYDSEIFDVHEVELDFFSADVKKKHFFFSKGIAGVNFYLFNYSVFEIKQNRFRLVDMLVYEYGAFCVNYYIIMPKFKIKYFEIEERLISRIFSYYNFGFFDVRCVVNRFSLYRQRKVSIYLVKYVILSVRRHVKSIKRVFDDFLFDYFKCKTNTEKLSYLSKILDNYEFFYVERNNSFFFFIKSNIQYLVNLCDFIYYSNINFSCTFSDVLLYAERLLILKGLFPGELSFVGYFFLAREVLLFLEIFPTVSRKLFWLKLLEFKDRIKYEEFCFFKYNYNLYQICIRYGLGEAMFFFESKLKNELLIKHVNNIPKKVRWIIFFEECCMFFVYFFMMFFFLSDFFDIFGDVMDAYGFEEEDFEERWAIYFPTQHKRAVFEYYSMLPFGQN